MARKEYFQGFHPRVLKSQKGRVKFSLPIADLRKWHYFLLTHGFTYHREEKRFTKYIGHIDLEARGIREREYTANELVIEVNRLTKRVRYTAYILAYSEETDLLRSWDLLEGLILGEMK